MVSFDLLGVSIERIRERRGIKDIWKRVREIERMR
jgi:hypothetical protein